MTKKKSVIRVERRIKWKRRKNQVNEEEENASGRNKVWLTCYL